MDRVAYRHPHFWQNELKDSRSTADEAQIVQRQGGTRTAETLQGLTPDRSLNFQAALYGAGGVIAAALLAELFIRARRRRADHAN